MKHTLILIFFLLLATITFSQSNLLLKKIKLADSLRIACLTDHLDSLQINKRFTFYCEKKDDVSDILKTFTRGDKTKQIGESNEIHIYILKGKEIQPIQIMINPKYENINTNVLGDFNYYNFDTVQLANAHDKYPIDFICKWLTFETENEFNKFLQTSNKDSNLICYEVETEAYPGRGIITIKKDKVVKDGFKGEDYLDAILKKLTSNEKEYSVCFIPKELNNGTYTFGVDCRKEVFDKISNERCQKQGWTKNKLELLTYWRK